MEKNRKLLDQWYEPFKNLPKLKWKEMKEIYKQMLLCEEDKEKKELQNIRLYACVLSLLSKLYFHASFFLSYGI